MTRQGFIIDGLTIHEKAWTACVNRAMLTPTGAIAIGQSLDALDSGKLNCCREIVGQYVGGYADIYESFAVALFHSNLGTGKYARCEIEMSAEPYMNGSKRNGELMNDLPEPFYGCFDGQAGRGADSDGFIGWNEPVEFEVMTWDQGWRFQYLMIPPRIIPLEIGTTCVSRTMLHMAESRGIARYPYGRDAISLFVATSSIVPTQMALFE